ncbi:MBL fold metallo-hydrolase [Limnoglobus roseus]|uniref:MBL fold metallo-hydrolase n=1 Tax=Limnoglobus roseus TaxID=2598579 RepID=A0A5C1AHR6_9BACT|nr:MBL fold metallo-hydrolase [Limnoglobus roseus]QEL16508.1 MBL fold metallo-hydrolase [Limnoglobus roseus]
MRVQIETIESQPFSENSYLVWPDGGREAFVIDPGFEPELILEQLAAKNLRLAAIVNTHAHLDHIAGNTAMKEAFPDAPIIIGHGEATFLGDPKLNRSAFYGMPLTSPPADRTVKDGDVLELVGLAMDVREIPGHSPGHVVYILRDLTPTLVLGGDVLFRGSVGRTDFPGGSFEVLEEGIHAKLWPLPDDTVVYPGHGPVTTIGREKRSNPFVGGGR